MPRPKELFADEGGLARVRPSLGNDSFVRSRLWALVPIGEDQQSAIPQLGFLEGALQIPDDFDEMLSAEDLRTLFEGRA